MTTTTSSGTRAASPGLPGAGMTVGLFITCINDVMFPQTGVAVTTLLAVSYTHLTLPTILLV